jgi:small-conductance mechanosensitive channel
VLKLLRFFLNRYLDKATKTLKVDPTQYHFLVTGLNFLGYLAALIIILYGIPGLKQVGVSLFAGAGVFAAVLGFASQTVFSNMISGISLVITKPFRVGDMLHVKSNYTAGWKTLPFGTRC